MPEVAVVVGGGAALRRRRELEKQGTGGGGVRVSAGCHGQEGQCDEQSQDRDEGMTKHGTSL